LTIPSIGVIGLIGQSGDVGFAIGSLLHFSLLFYFSDIILLQIFSKRLKKFFGAVNKNHGYLVSTKKIPIVMVAVPVLLIIYGLSSIGESTISRIFNSSYDASSTAQYYGIIGAYAIDIVRYIDNQTSKISTVEKKAIADWVKNNSPNREITPLTGVAKGKNVIIIQVESLGSFVINKAINGKKITPNLNALSQTSQFYPNNHFEIGAGHTSDTDFVVNTSLFPLIDASVFVRYGQDDFSSLPKTLIKNGYSAYAYHGFNRNFWNRDTALSSLGYQKFYAADNYPKGPKINMGLNDGDFLDKTADYIIEQPKPSLSYSITLSSHTGFEITDLTKGLGLKPDDYPSQVAGYMEDINYVDRMLGKFFDKFKAAGLYDDSLIVIFGDHTPVLPAFNTGDVSYNPDTSQVKEVPLLFKIPGVNIGETHANKGNHLDIMPTILDLLGIKTNQLMFGQSLFTSEKDSLTMCPNQMVAFSNTDDCNSALNVEKIISEKIIRYNLFDILEK
jgi:phosphoglycerol transferase MdoB-like AlkP superfamily enzyme